MSDLAATTSVATVVRLDGELDWQPFDIPGGTEPVSLVQLRFESDTRARTVAVRFPAGWQRPATGYYEAAEDVVFLQGTLAMGGVTYRARDWSYIPAGCARAGSTAESEVLAVARFSAPARWHVGYDPSADPPLHRSLDVAAATPAPSLLGDGCAWQLRSGTPDSSWLVEAPEPGTRSPVDAELLDVGARVWAWVPAGATFPDLEGLCFCRVFSRGTA